MRSSVKHQPATVEAFDKQTQHHNSVSVDLKDSVVPVKSATSVVDQVTLLDNVKLDLVDSEADSLLEVGDSLLDREPRPAVGLLPAPADQQAGGHGGHHGPLAGGVDGGGGVRGRSR